MFAEEATIFHMKQHDTLPAIVEALSSDTGPIDLTNATQILFRMKKGSATPKVNAAASVVGDPVDGVVTYQWVTGDTTELGTFQREWQITFAGGGILTVPNDLKGYSVSVTADLA